MSTVAVGCKVRVTAVNNEAEGIKSFELSPVDATPLPAFTAGAHVDLYLQNDLTRSYSLINPQGELHRYVVAINRDEASRGGSVFIHDSLRVGSELIVGAPRNNFPLVEDAGHIVFIAGGIGITPLWCMIQRLEAIGQPWTLYYSARNRKNAAFLGALLQLAEKHKGRVHLNFDREPGGRMLDLAAIVATQPADAHFYCCGPVPMLEAFERACAERPAENVHVEYFSAKADAAADIGGFEVVLAKSGRRLAVPVGESILNTLLENDIDAPYSCTEGVCGACKTSVIEGVPDHRDHVLTEAEQQTNQLVMICCSGSRTPSLVIDL